MNKGQPDLLNIAVAVVLSLILFIGWQYFIVGPQLEVQRQHALAEKTAADARQVQTPGAPGVSAPLAPGSEAAATLQKPEVILAGDRARIKLDSDTVDGSIRLTGARLDDLHFKAYREDIDPKSPEIVFLLPQGAETATYGEMGWTAGGTSNEVLPTETTVWQAADGQTLTPATPVTLTWDNGQGLLFTRTIALDKDYMFTVTDSVENKSAATVTMFPYASVARHGEPKTKASTWIVHEGPLGAFQGASQYPSYSDVRKAGEIKNESTGGWLGITDKYWMVAVIPPQNEKFVGRYSMSPQGGIEVFRADYLMAARTIAPTSKATVIHHFFAGPKVSSLLNAYKDNLHIQLFDYAIDWGWFWLITPPMLGLVDFLNRLVGNFGIAILMLTVVVKGLMFPLANRAFESMTKMKKVQPQIKELQERWKEDKAKLQQAQMELFRREKINPMLGCLPLLIQLPVFFSLYKVLLVTIEMRHAPFFGWIHDLAAADPTSLINLFGLLPFAVPSWAHIGVWPLLMGATMWLQMRMNPPATDPVQQQMMTFMPFVFTYMMSSQPAGLVIYWTWNNILTMSQQYVIMRRLNVPFQLNIKAPAWLTSLFKGPSGSPGE